MVRPRDFWGISELLPRTIPRSVIMYTSNFHKSDISNLTFLITGGAGFIGSNIVEYLLQFGAKKVKVIDNLSTGDLKNIEPFINNPSFEFIEADICNYSNCIAAMQDVDFVSHQAALGSVPRSIEDPIAANEANVTGFLNIITAARESGVKRLVYASSSSVYGDEPTLPKVESKIGNPLSPYAVTKYANELYAKVAHLNYHQALIGLRYFNVFGPRQSPQGAYAAVIPLFIEAMLKGESPFINGDGKQTRDFTFIENAVQANIRALFTENDSALGEVFNVAVGERFTLLELFDFIKEKTNSKVEVTHREARLGDIKDSLADIGKASKLLGYEPTIHFQEGLDKTISWFRSKSIQT